MRYSFLRTLQRAQSYQLMLSRDAATELFSLLFLRSTSQQAFNRHFPRWNVKIVAANGAFSLVLEEKRSRQTG